MQEMPFNTARIVIEEEDPLEFVWEDYLLFIKKMVVDAPKGSPENPYDDDEFPENQFRISGCSLKEIAALKKTWNQHPELWGDASSDNPEDWQPNWDELEQLTFGE